MGYIKFVLSRTTDEQGNTTYARISRIESDMADTSMLETNLIMHALSAPGGKVEQESKGFPYAFSLIFGE
ncbi:hypothetical protein [Bacteroides intestinalis]|jgi:hypothetical protein|uniref:hypothetical protein n=1 Tax=Bacteroides intestinalis TaxID=329854 RepID=UPI000E4A1A07|nr:hypothetical protein [Bacteroides intestinalis]RHA57614.1 hypothetical protein DW932_18045 [Bacteroides intestinalis]DAJ80774.1 MAG TPA: hypothetical protein [Caudoviricetes sp.]